MHARGSRWSTALAIAVVFFACRAKAQPAEAPPASAAPEPAAAPDSKKLQQAKDFFRKGNELRAAGDFAGALTMYLASRRLVPSIPNTWNSALTLEKLGRYDEALEMYEQLLTGFPGLEEKDRNTIGPSMQALRSKLGSLDVSANVDGVLLVDGRQRGELPLTSPVAVLPGQHVVRVLKDGYDTFESTVTIKARQKTLVDARLKRLTHVGKLRVEDAELAGADLFIDDGKVGTLPWEGTLAPGRHRYHVRKKDVGSAPHAAIVVEGQTVLVELKTGPLGGDMRFVTDPPTAELSIDGVALGSGQWQGRLPVGPHVVEAREAGYFAERRSIDVARTTSGTTNLKLRVDVASLRWSRGEQGKPWAEAFAGWALARSFGSDAESDCANGVCSNRSLVMGPVIGLRGAYEFPVGVAVELGLGALSLSTKLERKVSDSYDGGNGSVPIRYTLTDRIRMQGPFAFAGAAYPVKLSERAKLVARADVGVVFAGVRDEIDGNAAALGRSVPVEVENSGKIVRSAAVFVSPELRFTWKVGAVDLGVGLGALIFPVTGPRLETGDTRVTHSDQCNPNPPPSGQSRPVECAKNSSAVAAERSYSAFIAWLPTVSVGYAF